MPGLNRRLANVFYSIAFRRDNTPLPLVSIQVRRNLSHALETAIGYGDAYGI